jgi:hypothetical protein
LKLLLHTAGKRSTQQIILISFPRPYLQEEIEMTKITKPSTVKIWVTAARPHTLTASIAPVLVAHQVVVSSSRWKQTHTDSSTDSTLLYLSITFAAFACLIQLGTNLHNDYADFIKGADTDKRGLFVYFLSLLTHVCTCRN